jgi:hypothetical protein
MKPADREASREPPTTPGGSMLYKAQTTQSHTPSTAGLRVSCRGRE